eukprot:16439913-Heterocapsa_arctica.AAC.1
MPANGRAPTLLEAGACRWAQCSYLAEGRGRPMPKTASPAERSQSARRGRSHMRCARVRG